MTLKLCCVASAGDEWFGFGGRFVDVHYGHQKLYVMNRRSRAIEVYQFRELRSFENGQMMKNVVLDRLADSFIGVKDAWVTFAASDQPSIGRYVARDAVKLYMSPWYAATSLTKRRVARWSGRGRLEAPTPAAVAW